MNRKMVFYTTGQIILIEALMLLLPAAVSLIYNESCLTAFLVAVAVALALGGALTLIFRTKGRTI